jgi:hypothetical protein
MTTAAAKPIYPWSKDNGIIVQTWNEKDDETKQRVTAIVVRVPRIEGGYTQDVWCALPINETSCYLYPQGQREEAVIFNRV